MQENLDDQIAALRRLSVTELRGRYEKTFGEVTAARHKTWLVRRIAWRTQALAEGDLAYDEDSAADSDFNVVMTGSGRFIEFQGSAEAAPFDRVQLDAIVVLAQRGIDEMIAAQKKALGD